MANYGLYHDKLVMCPFDEAHKVKESRLQLHIAKCKLNNLDKLKQKDVCPFNATHIFDRSERTYHLLNCPDRSALDAKLAKNMDKNNPLRKGNTSVPSYNESLPVETEENWDDEISDSVGPGYVPKMQPPPGAIIQPPEMSKPAERRKLYKELFRMTTDPDKSKESKDEDFPKLEVSPKPQPPSAAKFIEPPAPLIESPEPVHIPRQPKQPDEACQARKMAQEQQNIGIGRGKPSTRIAANFFAGNATKEKNDNFSYAAVLHGINHLGLGRGETSSQSTTPAFDDDDDDEFPVLGRGRGVPQMQKSRINRPGHV